MDHFLVNIDGKKTCIEKHNEINRFYIIRTWLIAKTGCSETISRCWIGWKYYKNIYSKDIMLKLESLEKECMINKNII